MADTDTTGLGAAAERLRQAARWLVVGFGAVAAAVFTGVSVSDFGNVARDTAPFWIAVGCAGVALIGTLTAMLIAMSLAGASTVSVHELRRPGDRTLDHVKETIKSDPVLAPWDGDVATFFQAMDTASRSYQTALDAWRDDPAKLSSVQRSADYVKALLKVQTEIMATASYLRLTAGFRRARWWMAIALLVAAGCTLVFSVVTR